MTNSVLRLFDELVKCDEDGILKDVRKAVEGKEQTRSLTCHRETMMIMVSVCALVEENKCR